MSQVVPANVAAMRDLQRELAKSDRVLHNLLIEEIEPGADGEQPIAIELSGSVMPQVGATWGSKVTGGKFTPIGQKWAIQSVTGVEWDDTEMVFSLDAVFFRDGDVKVIGADDIEITPEGLHRLFVRLQKRARACSVRIAGFARVGVLREVKAQPGRAYQVQPITGEPGPPGVNIELSARWEWRGEDIPNPRLDIVFIGDELAGRLESADSRLASALADSDPFAPDFFEKLNAAAGNLRKGINDCRKALRGLGDLARAPAKAANNILSAARTVGNLITAFEDILSDTADEYRAVGTNVGTLLRMKRAAGAASSAAHDARDVVASIFDALEQRKGRSIGVRPGANLADIAAAELGSAARWEEIATLNELPGQIVPKGVYSVELPPRGA